MCSADRQPVGGRRLGTALLALLLASRAVWAQPPVTGEDVIPPGFEAVLADMLGRGAALPDGCTFNGGQIGTDAATATYHCPGGAVRIELRHPGSAPPQAPRTDRFAIVVRDGAAPASLTAALEARVRARERDFEWLHVVSTGPRQTWLESNAALLLQGLAAMLAVAAAWWLRRRLAGGAAALARATRSLWRAASQGVAALRAVCRRRVAAGRQAARRWARDPRGELARLARDERAWMVAILVASAAARLALCVVNRESNDDHAIVAHMIRTGGWLPPAASACMECSHAKLYHYVLAAAFTYVSYSGETSRMLGNLLNFVAGTLLLALFARYVRRLPCSPPVRVLALACMSFNAALVGIFSQTTNDGFVILFASLTIYCLAGYLTQQRPMQVVAATVWAILAAASKASGWAIFMAGAAVLGVAVLAAGPRWRRAYAAAAAVFVVGFLLVASLVHPYRQNIATRGTPFVNDAYDTPVMRLEVPRSAAWPVQFFLTFRLAELLRVPYDDYEGGPYPLHRESLWSQLYGRTVFLRFDQGIWHNLAPGLLAVGRAELLLGLLPLSALLLGTAGVAAATLRGLWRGGLHSLSERTDWQHLVYVGVLLASLIALLIQYHRLEWLFIWMKAIYLLPAVLSLFALFALGLERLWRRWPRVTIGWMAALVLVSIVDLAWLIHDLAGSPSQ